MEKDVSIVSSSIDRLNITPPNSPGLTGYIRLCLSVSPGLMLKIPLKHLFLVVFPLLSKIHRDKGCLTHFKKTYPRPPYVPTTHSFFLFFFCRGLVALSEQSAQVHLGGKFSGKYCFLDILPWLFSNKASS